MYDAFMSYNHAAQGRLAPSLQSALQRLAKPWWRMRSLRVFRDTTSMSAAPRLWSSVVAALDSSRFFILLASPESARSGWVNREVEWWWNHRGAEGLLIVLTGGRLPWSAPDEPGDLALPPVLIENLVEDPLWVDLRWASGTEHVSSRNPRFREAVARLGASICERPLDEIIGEDVRRHRQTQRITRLAVTLLIALTITALIAARLAYLARDDAREQARIATARQLIAESSLRLSHRLDQAQLLAAAAYQVQPSTASRQALFAAAYASPYLHRFATQDGVVSSLAVSKNGRTVYVGESDGQRASLGFDSGKRIDLPCLPHLVNTLKLSDDEGALVAGSDHGEVELIDVATRTARQLPSMGSAPSWVWRSTPTVASSSPSTVTRSSSTPRAGLGLSDERR